MSKLSRLSVIIGAIVLAGVSGWIWMGRTGQEREVEQVEVRLKWLHQAQFAGHYLADQRGYYHEEGLSVELVPFDYVSFPIDEVAAGRAEFGVAGADELLIARSKGARVKALAVIYQDSPVVAYALASSGIKEPKDMLGKLVGIEKGVNVETLVRAMFVRQGIDADEALTLVPIGFDVAPLLNGEVDVATGYETNEPIQVEEKGHEVNIIAPYNYGIKMYGDVLFTSEELIKNKPEMVAGFVRATLKGWEQALVKPGEAVEMTLLYEDPNNVALNYDHQLRLLEKSSGLIKPTAGSRVGSMNYLNWSRTYELLRNSKLIQDELEVSEAYTREFLE